MALSEETLSNFYKMNFALLQYHKYSLEDIDNMIPFERAIYISLLVAYLKEEQDRLKQR